MRSWLPFDFKATLLKGRANYVSLRRWNRYLNAPSRRADGTWFDDEVKFKMRMLVWLAQTRNGDRSEIKLNGFEELFWLRAASTPDDCLAADCRQAVTDFFRAVRPVLAQGQPEFPLRPGREEPIILDASSRAWPESIALAKLASVLGDGAATLRRALDSAGAQLPFESNPY